MTPEEPVLISSPNYPGNYPNNVEMTVDISAPRGYNVELIFLDLELSPSCMTPLVISESKLYYTVSINLKLSKFEKSYSLAKNTNQFFSKDINSCDHSFVFIPSHQRKPLRENCAI